MQASEPTKLRSPPGGSSIVSFEQAEKVKAREIGIIRKNLVITFIIV